MSEPRLRDPAHRVSSRAPLLWGAVAVAQAVGGAVALVLVTVVWDWFSLPVWAFAVYAAAALVYVVGMPLVRFRVHRWESTSTAVYTQTGWLTRERRIAPMSRVQTVDLAQGVVDRLVGLASVTVTTASAAGPLKIEALDRTVAETLVGELTRRSEAERDDAT